MHNPFRTLLTLMLLGAGLAGPAQATWNEAFSTRTRVVVDTTPAGLSLPAPLGEVVLPIRLHSGNFDFLAAAPDGSDIRVLAADDKTPLPFEVERFDAANELALIWVRLPRLAQGSDQNLVQVYAGASAAAPAAGPRAFDGQASAIAHLGEAQAPFQERLGSAALTGPGVPETNGLLAGAMRLAGGEAMRLPLGGRLNLKAPGALTLALWIKPDAAGETATLMSLGDLSLRRSVDQLELVQGATRVSGGALPGSAWAHVALVVGSGQARLFVNGQPAAQTELLLSDGQPTDLQLGAGFRGLMDEVQVWPVAQDPAWVLLQARAQGADNAFVRTQRESPEDAEGGGEPGYMGILVKNLTVDAWVVIGILGVMFVIAAWVMVSKALLVARIGQANSRFLAQFHQASGAGALAAEPTLQGSTLMRLYQAGQQEIDKREAAGRTPLSGASLDAIRATLDGVQVRENHQLNARMVLLTIAISGGPFLGLLGTVVGVMITFAAIAAAGDVNVNAIAPGIAAALLATVAGLGVAIPALFGYNWLASRIKTISADMQIFVDEFVTRAAELHGER